MISELTSEQWQQIDELRESEIERATLQVPDEEIIESVRAMYKYLNLPIPEIVVCDSPSACRKAARSPQS